jgi:uncharacterized MAPEG superfamily protein
MRLSESSGSGLHELYGDLSFFAAVVLAAHIVGHHGMLTLLGAHLYFWGRLGYVLAAAAGFGLLRSTLFFNSALLGIVLFLIALLH